MPRLNVIILDQIGDDINTFRVALWMDVPLARQVRYAVAGAKSIWTNATTADNTAIASGAVVEKVVTQRVPGGASLPQREQFLQDLWTSYQNQINSYNPWQRSDSTWDGTTWVVQNNG